MNARAGKGFKDGFKNGFTLIELMVVIAVVAILATIASPSFVSLINSQRVKSAASTLQSALIVTRSEALKRNDSVSLVPVVAEQWNQGWSVRLTDGSVLSAYGAVSGVSIAGGPASVVFLGSGRVSGATDAAFLFSAENTSVVRCVTISLSGVPTITSSGC